MAQPSWIPENVLEQFIPFYIEQPMNHPELYDTESNVEIVRLFMMFGRSGNHKGRILYEELVRRNIPSQFIDVKPGHEHESMDIINQRIREMGGAIELTKTTDALPTAEITFHTIVVENAEQLNKTSDPALHESILGLVKRVEGIPIVIIMSYGTVPNNMNSEIRSIFPAQVYWKCPNDAWRKSYFKRAFERYHALVAPSSALHVIVDMDDDDYDFLVDSSHYHTVEELWQFVKIVNSAVHRIGNVHKCDTRRMNGTEASVHDRCSRMMDDVLHRVICIDRIREHHLKGMHGNYSISAMNAKSLEDLFFNAARGAFLAEPDNTRKVILYDEPENDLKRECESKITFENADQRFVFDPKTGKEVPVDASGTPIQKDAATPPLKKVKLETETKGK